MNAKLITVCCIVLLGISCEHTENDTSQFEVHGIDVSHHQSYINWDSVIGHNFSFVYIKATEGEQFVDSMYQRNWQESRRVGIKRGAYHFFRPSLSATLQADNFIAQVHLEDGDLLPVLDLEVLDNVPIQDFIFRAKLWLTQIENHYGVKPIIYTYFKFYNKYLAGQLEDYPIWIARYNNKSPKLANRLQWTFWQHQCEGNIAGINTLVDLNVFNGDKKALESISYYKKFSELTQN